MGAWEGSTFLPHGHDTEETTRIQCSPQIEGLLLMPMHIVLLSLYTEIQMC